MKKKAKKKTAKKINLIGKKIGKLTVIEQDNTCRKKHTKFWCQCDCGSPRKSIRRSHLLQKYPTRSCGCVQPPNTIPINIGDRFGRLTIISSDVPRAKGHKQRFKCKCECGNEKIARRDDLLQGKTKSCGCLKKTPIDIGYRCGKLVVIGIAPARGSHRVFLCQCDCGSPPKEIRGTSLIGKNLTKSCGCIWRETVEVKSVKVGDRFGKLVIVSLANAGTDGLRRVICQCDCGSNPKEFRVSNLTQSRLTKSCGCLATEVHKSKNIWETELNYVKSSAVYRKKEWNLTQEQFNVLVQGNCFYCGKLPSTPTIVGIPKLLRNGIDRMDSSKGYAVENCISSCGVCNVMKMDWTVNEFLDIVAKINHFQQTPPQLLFQS